MLSIYLIVYMLICLKNVFVSKYDIAKKENVYAKIKDNLSYIYLNYNECKKYLK